MNFGNTCGILSRISVKNKCGRTKTTANIFKLKFTVSTIVKKISSVSTSLYFCPANFADIIHWRLNFKTSIGK
ncbi:hypothetical protein Bca101_082570 [Brassica carinata]